MKRISALLLLLFLKTGVFAQLNVSLVMPFCSKEIVANPKNPNAELGNICREYYQGLLIALDSLGKTGAQVNLNVFDTQNDSMTMLKIMQKQAFKESQFIIGPVLQGGNKMITPFAIDKKVYHVSPLMTFSKTKLNDPYWISTNPNLTSFGNILSKFIQDFADTANIIVISDQAGLDKSVSAGIKAGLGTNKNYKLKFLPYTSGLDVNAVLSDHLQNIVVIPTHNEQIANSVLYNLKDTSETNKMICIGFQQWFEFKNADISLWERKQVYFATTFFVDYLDSASKRFIELYRERFNTEPSESAIKGYDQGLLLIGERITQGKDFMEKIAGRQFHTIHTDFRFTKQKEGGAYHNDCLNLVFFENNRLVRYRKSLTH